MKVKKLYSTQVKATGGREGRAISHDQKLDVTLALPVELGGPRESVATNPEQLFGAGYAACFDSALRHVARSKRINIVTSEVTADVSLHLTLTGGFALDVKLDVSLPELDRAVAEELVAKAHQVCPYSNATRGNLDVQINLR